jgi:hypothetical protein
MTHLNLACGLRTKFAVESCLQEIDKRGRDHLNDADLPIAAWRIGRQYRDVTMEKQASMTTA